MEPARLKAGISPSDRRDSRRLSAASNRKDKRETNVRKRRGGVASEFTAPLEFDTLVPLVRSWVQAGGPAEGFATVLQAMRNLRSALTDLRSIDDVVANLGLVLAVVDLLQHPAPALQFEAAGCLANIASGSGAQCRSVVSAGALPHLLALLDSSCVEVSEAAASAVGNIGGESVPLRDAVLEAGGLAAALRLIQSCTASFGTDGDLKLVKLGALRHATWAVSSLLRGEPPPDVATAQPAVSAVAYLLGSVKDASVQADACWAIVHLVDGGDHAAIDAVVGCAGLVPLLVHVLRGAALGAARLGDGSPVDVMQPVGADERGRAELPALRALCGLLSTPTAASAAAAQWATDAGLLDALAPTLRSPDTRVRREGALALARLTRAGAPSERLDAIVADEPIMTALIGAYAAGHELRALAAAVVSHLLSAFDAEPCLHSAARVYRLVQRGVVPPTAGLLRGTDPELLRTGVESARMLLAAGELITAQTGLTAVQLLQLRHAPRDPRSHSSPLKPQSALTPFLALARDVRAAGCRRVDRNSTRLHSTRRADGAAGSCFALSFEEAGGLEALELLQDHPNARLAALAFGVLERHFAEHDDDDVNDDGWLADSGVDLMHEADEPLCLADTPSPPPRGTAAMACGLLASPPERPPSRRPQACDGVDEDADEDAGGAEDARMDDGGGGVGGGNLLGRAYQIHYQLASSQHAAPAERAYGGLEPGCMPGAYFALEVERAVAENS